MARFSLYDFKKIFNDFPVRNFTFLYNWDLLRPRAELKWSTLRLVLFHASSVKSISKARNFSSDGFNCRKNLNCILSFKKLLVHSSETFEESTIPPVTSLHNLLASTIVPSKNPFPSEIGKPELIPICSV